MRYSIVSTSSIELMTKENIMQSQETYKGAKATYTNVMLPKCEAVYMHIAEQDRYEDKECGYSITVRLDPTDVDHSEFIKRIDAACGRAYEEWKETASPVARKNPYSKHSPIKDEYDRTTGELTGMVLFKATTKMTPKVYDQTADEIAHTRCKGMSRGTEVAAKIVLKSVVLPQRRSAGCVAYITAVQIINPCYRSSDESDAGFSDVGGKGGFVNYGTQTPSKDTYSGAGDTFSGDENFDTNDKSFDTGIIPF
jgi:hypothetical protein